MNPTQTCECGTLISSHQGRCPTCGADWGALAPLRPSSQPAPPPQLAPNVAARRARERSRLPIVVAVVAAVVLVSVAVTLWAALRRSDEAPPEAAPSATVAPVASTAPDDSGPMALASLSAVAPDGFVGRATKLALAWSPEAQLVAIDATGLRAGVVDARNGGTVRVSFGKPAGSKLGPGAWMGAEQFAVSVTKQGSVAQKEQAQRAVAVGAAPMCTAAQAHKAAIASGVPAKLAVDMSFRFSRQHGKAVWTVSVRQKPKLSRTLDARSCAVIVR